MEQGPGNKSEDYWILLTALGKKMRQYFVISSFRLKTQKIVWPQKMSIQRVYRNTEMFFCGGVSA